MCIYIIYIYMYIRVHIHALTHACNGEIYKTKNVTYKTRLCISRPRLGAAGAPVLANRMESLGH